MSNALELLMSAELNVVEKPKKLVEIVRLTEILGQKFEVEVQSISFDDLKEIEREARTNPMESTLLTIDKGLVNPNIKDKALQEKYGCKNHRELLKKLFVPGDIVDICASITEVSGLNKDMVSEVKNF